MSLPTNFLRPLITAAAQSVSLPWWRSWPPGVWLEALVLQESGGNPKATRYEAHQDVAGRKDADEDADAPQRDDGPLEDDQSYGLMQVMGYNARRLCGVPPGTPMNFGFLLRPITNIAFGLRILCAELEAAKQSVPRALARYNGGSTGDDTQADGSMRRQVYVNGVAEWAAKVHKERGGWV